MHTVHLGSETEHVRITVPAAFGLDGWAQVQVEVAVQCFRGSVQPYLERPDIERSLETLRRCMRRSQVALNSRPSKGSLPSR
jgi:hypothetical protein